MLNLFHDLWFRVNYIVKEQVLVKTQLYYVAELQPENCNSLFIRLQTRSFGPVRSGIPAVQSNGHLVRDYKSWFQLPDYVRRKQALSPRKATRQGNAVRWLNTKRTNYVASNPILNTFSLIGINGISRFMFFPKIDVTVSSRLVAFLVCCNAFTDGKR